MFTGIIQTIGTVKSLSKQANAMRLQVELAVLPQALSVGDSVANNGVCLTIVEINDTVLSFDVSPETLACTSLGQLSEGSCVNIETAMLPTTQFGGHMVSGHVDGLAEIIAIEEQGDYTQFVLNVPADIKHYIAKKGSVALDGVSLTVNSVDDAQFSVMIIPHTLQQTIFQHYQVGTHVNIEVDMLARYTERLLETRG
tara:strand:- start:11695 stop:12288 length:594 start_codon:yes stop_codon:yes gene_type:complete